MTTFPTWLTGPNGERRIFARAEDVPAGWTDGLMARTATAVAYEIPVSTAIPTKVEPTFTLDPLPEGWRSLHWRKLQKLAYERGAAADYPANKDSLIAYLDAWEREE